MSRGRSRERASASVESLPPPRRSKVSHCHVYINAAALATSRPRRRSGVTAWGSGPRGLSITQAAQADRLGISPLSLCRVELAPTPVPRELATKIHVAIREPQERPPFMRTLAPVVATLDKQVVSGRAKAAWRQ